MTFSLVVDENTYINNTSHLVTFIRGVDENFDITEELVDTVPITDPTSENDLLCMLRKVLKSLTLTGQN